MGGEKSKNTGEFGEGLVSNFFNLIGWKESNVQKGLALNCSNESHRNEKKKPKRTHGIDMLYTYSCPLVDGVLKNVIVSVKYMDEKYPQSATSRFKNDLLDLLETQECFALSEERHLATNGMFFDECEDIGVLFWLSNIIEQTHDYISIIENSQLPSNSDIGTTLIVDNKRVHFIIDCLNFVKSNFSSWDFSFYYPDTGKNMSATRKKDYGNSLPVEYLNTTILPIRIQNKTNPNNISLILFSIDPFHRDNLKQLIGLSQQLTKGWAGETYICYNDFNPLTHESEVKQAKNYFQNHTYTSTVSVMNYQQTHLNIK